MAGEHAQLPKQLHRLQRELTIGRRSRESRCRVFCFCVCLKLLRMHRLAGFGATQLHDVLPGGDWRK